MPIYEAAGSLILHFGHGDIAVNHGRNVEKDYEDELCFVRQEPHPIGARSDELIGKATDQLDTPVRFIFDKVESLDVVVKELQSLRLKMADRNPAASLEFRRELESLINRTSRENGSNTPDFILCEYLLDALAAFDRATNARERWYGRAEAGAEKYQSGSD